MEETKRRLRSIGPPHATQQTNTNASVSNLQTELRHAQADRRALREALNLFDDNDGATTVSILKKLNSDISSWATDLTGGILNAATFGNGLSVGRIVRHPRFQSVFTLGKDIQDRLGSDNREDEDIIELLLYYSLCSVATQTLLEHIFAPFHPILYPAHSNCSTINLITLSGQVQVQCKCAIVLLSELFLTCSRHI